MSLVNLVLFKSRGHTLKPGAVTSSGICGSSERSVVHQGCHEFGLCCLQVFHVVQVLQVVRGQVCLQVLILW